MSNGSERVAEKFTPGQAIAMVNNNLGDLGFIPRDADGNDYANGLIPTLRFKTGCSMGEITALVMVENKQVAVIRATSWAGVDRMILSIRSYVDNPIASGVGL